MLDVNPELSYRDVIQIIQQTAQPGNTVGNDYIENEAGVLHSIGLGFGMVDALAAVEVASTWPGVPSAVIEEAVFIADPESPLTIPDKADGGTEVFFEITPKQEMYLEELHLYVEVPHSSRGNIEITVISPGGTIGVIPGTSLGHRIRPLHNLPLCEFLG